MRSHDPGRWSFRSLALVAGLPLIATACTAAATPAPTAAPTAAATSGASAGPTTPATPPPPFTVRFLGSVGALGDWAPYVGMANGLWQRENINFQYSTFANPADIFNAIVSGKAWRDIQAAPALVLWEQTPDLFVLDVRTEGEWANGHIPRAKLVPLDELEDRLRELPAKDARILVHCAAGGRSLQACQILADKGYTRLLNLVGGMHAWPGPREQGGPPLCRRARRSGRSHHLHHSHDRRCHGDH